MIISLITTSRSLGSLHLVVEFTGYSTSADVFVVGIPTKATEHSRRI